MIRNRCNVTRLSWLCAFFLVLCFVLWIQLKGPIVEEKPVVYMDVASIQLTLDNLVCENYRPEKRFLGLILITSYVANWEHRMTHRNTISQKRLADMGMQRIFLLGQVPSIELSINQSHLAMEQNEFGDLLQGSFTDTYRNLSYKYVMGFTYAITRCQDVAYIVKADDDIVQDLYQVYNFLNMLELYYTEVAHSARLLGGIISYDPPQRNKLSPWYVSYEEYPSNTYPENLAGWLFITNIRTMEHILSEVENVPFFWVPDVWITGIVRKHLNLPLVNLYN